MRGKLYHKAVQWIRGLVLNDYYLPLMGPSNVTILIERGKFKGKETANDLKKKAVEILSLRSDEAEMYRQGIYRTLAFKGRTTPQELYTLSLWSYKAVKGAINLDDEFVVTRKDIIGGEFRKSEYKKATSMAMTLVLLNFGYVDPSEFYDVIHMGVKQLYHMKAIYAGVQSLALRRKLPIYDDSALPEDYAANLVEAAFEIRKYIVKIILNRRPRLLTDLYQLLLNYIVELARKRDIKELEEFASTEALLESTIVPFYLYQYGFVKFDHRTLVFHELKYF